MDRSNNKMAKLLVNVAIKPNDDSFNGISIVEVKNRLSIPNNIENWQVFEDDKDILQFMLSEGKYCSQELDCSAFVEIVDGKEIVFGQEILQLKMNKLPKGLVMLESAFDNQDRFTSEVKDKNPKELEEVNLGIVEAPKKVYIGKKISPKIKKALIDLLKKYRHVLAWS